VIPLFAQVMLVRFGKAETSIVPPSFGELVPQTMLVTLAGEESERVNMFEEILWLVVALLVKAMEILSSKRFTAPVKTERNPVIVLDIPDAKAHNFFGQTSFVPRYTNCTSVVPFSILITSSKIILM
jgi:hypothetical protein